MGKSKDNKGSREAKEDKKLALGVKKQQLKRKKDRALECAVDSEPAAEHGVKKVSPEGGTSWECPKQEQQI